MVNTPKKEAVKRDLEAEIDILDNLLSEIVEILKERRLLTQEEWERRVKGRVRIR